MTRRDARAPYAPGALPGLVLLAGLLAGAALVTRSPAPAPAPSPGTEPRVRVQLVRDAHRIRLRSDAPLILTTPGSLDETRLDASEWIVVRPDRDGGLLAGADELSDRSISIRPARRAGAIEFGAHDGTAWSLSHHYPGELRISIEATGRIEVINVVGIEPYVAAVVAAEAWPGFDEEAIRAQAIVARSYVLDQATRRAHRGHDVSATEASQVYRGLRRDEAAIQAAEATAYTRGLVCTTGEADGHRVVTTYYHAVCGGITQSGEIFGEVDAAGPLRGGVTCAHCAIAPAETYRWGPIMLDRREVLRRLRDRYAELEPIRRITDVRITERAAGGRAKMIRITGTDGRHEDFLAERFRLAIGARELPSTHVEVRLAGRTVIFEHGRGFGHGIGLCQWGAEGLARTGRTAAEILRFYYPGVRLTRAY